MGYNRSWLAARGVKKVDFLKLFGLRDAGAAGDYSQAFRCAELATGWTVLVAEDVDFASPDHLEGIVNAYPVLGCQASEGDTYSAVHLHERSKSRWLVSHWSDRGEYDLEVVGEPPAELAALRDRYVAAQKARPPGRPGLFLGNVDHMWEIPVELARALTGYRLEEEDETDFTEAVRR